MKKYVVPFLMNLEIALFPVLVLYFNNASELSFTEAIPSIIFMLLLSVLSFALCVIVYEIPAYAGINSAVLVALLSNFYYVAHFFSGIIPWMRYWHILPVSVLIVILLGSILSEVSVEIMSVLCKSLSVVFLILLILNGVTKIPMIIERAHNLSQLEGTAVEKNVEHGENVETKNIYILIFDEYASFRQMKDAYGFENKDLNDYLINKGFAVSYDSHNESIMTNTVITNMLNIDYVVDNYMSSSEKELIRKNGRLFNVLQEQNYAIRKIEYGSFLGDDSLVRSKEKPKGKTIDKLSFTQIVLKRSFMYPFVKGEASSVINGILEVADYVMNMDKPSNNTMSIIYLDFPHQPFFVNENGEFNLTSDNSNWKNKDLYLGQYKYATKLMIKMVDSIIKKDPDSVVMICSDHGARASTDPDLFMKGFYSLDYASNEFLAVYYMGDDYSKIQNQSNVNAIRIILDDVLGLGLGVIDVPEDNYNYVGGEA